MARRKHDGLKDCTPCIQEAESADHLTVSSVFKIEMWFRVLAPLGLAQRDFDRRLVVAQQGAVGRSAKKRI